MCDCNNLENCKVCMKKEKRKASAKKYRQSEKGKIAIQRYEQSENIKKGNK